MSGVVLSSKPLSLDTVLKSVLDPGFGAVVIFLGVVRDREKGDAISSIRYEAYEAMAAKELEVAAKLAREEYGAKAVVHHRLGDVPAGSPSVIVACAAAHRDEAFNAARSIIERIKERIPIWKVDFKGAS